MQKRLQRKPIHPGEILREQFMAEFGVGINRLARDLRVAGDANQRDREPTPAGHIRYRAAAARHFGTTPEFWMNLQTSYDLDTARSGVAAIERDVRPIQAA